jgi:hypothetical protein
MAQLRSRSAASLAFEEWFRALPPHPVNDDYFDGYTPENARIRTSCWDGPLDFSALRPCVCAEALRHLERFLLHRSEADRIRWLEQLTPAEKRRLNSLFA